LEKKKLLEKKFYLFLHKNQGEKEFEHNENALLALQLSLEVCETMFL